MKQLMIIPLSMMALMSLGYSSGPVKPASLSLTTIADTTVPGHHKDHMKGNNTDTTGLDRHGKKPKHSLSGSNQTGTGTLDGSPGGSNKPAASGSNTK